MASKSALLAIAKRAKKGLSPTKTQIAKIYAPETALPRQEAVRFKGTRSKPLTERQKEWNRLAAKAQRNARQLVRQGYIVPEEYLSPKPPSRVTKAQIEAMDLSLGEMRSVAVRRGSSGAYITAATDKALKDAYKREEKRIRRYISRRAGQGFIFDDDKVFDAIGWPPTRPTEEDVKRLAAMRGAEGILKRFAKFRLSADGEVFSVEEGLEQIKRGEPFEPFTASGSIDADYKETPWEKEQRRQQETEDEEAGNAPPVDESRPDWEYTMGVISIFRATIGELCSMLNGDVDPETGLVESSRSYMEKTLDRWIARFGPEATARVIVQANREGLIDSDHLYLYVAAMQTAATMTQFFQDQGFILPYERELIQEEMEAGEVWYDYDNGE